ncbi:lectin [Mycena belliarum]|uniref:Lectin n=1 Tax=Mycena belliarum TaxID=1033014 RepID=A0AAD6TV65_9AGAR|nr:lectin [Mycena belliae]
MYQGKPVVVQTSNFGGAQDTPFNDNEEASKFPDTERMIDPQHPIQQMQISSGWAVDAITTTYRMSDGSTKALARGSKIPSGSPNTKVVTLSDNEVITQICGFAGPYSYYKKSLLIQMMLVITDKSTGKIRTAGPFGGGNGTAQGTFFSVSSPLALAGFHSPDSPQVGMAGLSIVKSSMVE